MWEEQGNCNPKCSNADCNCITAALLRMLLDCCVKYTSHNLRKINFCFGQ